MDQKRIWPNFLIVGAAKSGTTSVYHYLKDHPEVFMSENKEPCFFSSYEIPRDIHEKNVFPANGDRRIRDLDRYLSLFADADPARHKAIGEASTHYLFQYPESIDNIKKLYRLDRDPRIIIILRNPVEAAYSNYTMWAMRGLETEPFFDVLKASDQRYADQYYNVAYIQKFRYHDQVKAYLDHFEQVKVCVHEDLEQDAARFMRAVFQFLDIAEDYVPANITTRFNRSGAARYKAVDHIFGHKSVVLPRMQPALDRLFRQDRTQRWITRIREWNLKKDGPDEAIVRYMKDKYRDDIIRTGQLIGRDLTAWIR